MDGYQLYKKYTTAGQLATLDSDTWQYGQLVHQAFHLVGITRLFDLLEQAEASGRRLELIYRVVVAGRPPVPCDVQLVDIAPPALTSLSDINSLNRLPQPRTNYPWVFSSNQP